MNTATYYTDIEPDVSFEQNLDFLTHTYIVFETKKGWKVNYIFIMLRNRRLPCCQVPAGSFI